MMTWCSFDVTARGKRKEMGTSNLKFQLKKVEMAYYYLWLQVSPDKDLVCDELCQ